MKRFLCGFCKVFHYTDEPCGYRPQPEPEQGPPLASRLLDDVVEEEKERWLKHPYRS